MNTRLLAVALAAASALAAVPAAAQVSGVAVTDPSLAIAASQARASAYQQIGTTFQAQRTQIDQLQQQRNTLLRPFDTDNNGQLDDSEKAAIQANATAFQQIQGIEQQLNAAQAPISQAEVYVIEQLLMQYSPALQQVIAANNIKLIVNPNAVVWLDEPVDITEKVTAALNQLAPSVSTAVPAGWQPQRQSVAVFQEVQDMLMSAAIAQAQQQQAQQGAAAPAQQPVGR